MIIQSGNDASCALAEHVAGTQGDFAVLMNEYASELGMLDSNFVNPTGLPDVNHYSTARDLAKLSINMINDFPEHYSLYKEKEFTFDDIRQLNRNSLLWQDDSVDGIKTGHTNDSGYCLAGSAIRGETRFVSIVLNSASEKTRIRDTRRLLDYAFRFYQTKTIVKAYEPLTTVDVWAGIDEKVSLGLGSDLKITLQRNKFKNLELDLPSSLGVRAPISRDQKLDELILLSNGERIQSYDLVAITDVKKKSFISALWDNLIFSIYSFFMQDETT